MPAKCPAQDSNGVRCEKDLGHTARHASPVALDAFKQFRYNFSGPLRQPVYPPPKPHGCPECGGEVYGESIFENFDHRSGCSRIPL